MLLIALYLICQKDSLIESKNCGKENIKIITNIQIKYFNIVK